MAYAGPSQGIALGSYIADHFTHAPASDLPAVVPREAQSRGTTAARYSKTKARACHMHGSRLPSGLSCTSDLQATVLLNYLSNAALCPMQPSALGLYNAGMSWLILARNLHAWASATIAKHLPRSGSYMRHGMYLLQ